jgi:3-phenylpropionate/cinnamic acid dioxygenase small subunit
MIPALQVPGRWGVPERDFADAMAHAEASAFLARESEYMDSRRFSEWAELVDESFRYLVPVPVTPDNPLSPPFDPECLLLDESKASMIQLWFRRYEKGMYEIAWGENPPVRLRHFVTNVRVRGTDDENVYDVRSNVLLIGVRQGDAPAFLSAERFDLVRRTDTGLRLLRRIAILDETLLAFPQVRAML